MPWRIAAFAWLVFAAILPTARADTPAAPRFEYTRPAMGTQFRIVLHAPDEKTARRAADAAFARVEQLDKILSDYDASSELSKLSATGPAEKGVAVSDELWTMLARSQKLAAESDGAFDATVGPFSRLWRRARRQKALPTPEQLAEAKGAAGFQHLRLDEKNHTAQLLRPKMKLDLGGIAKGFAADEALTVLRKAGIPQAMVAASGDIALGDPPPGEPGWRVGVAPLKPDGKPTVNLTLARCGVSTSGDAFQYVTIDGRRYSHIVDPRTGIGLTTPSSVTIIAPDATTADALATAVCVLGPEAGGKLLAKHAGCEMLFVREENSELATTRSAGFDKHQQAPRETPKQ